MSASVIRYGEPPMSGAVNQEQSRWLSASARVSIFDGAAPGANTGIVPGGVKFSPTAAAARVTVALGTASVFRVTCTDGSDTHKWDYDGGASLAAEKLQTFTHAVRNMDQAGSVLTWNWEVATDGVIECLFVEEITGGVV